MNKRFIRRLLFLTLVITSIWVQAAPTHAQLPVSPPAGSLPSAAEEARPSGDLEFKEANKEAIDKLLKMPPAKVKALDDKLAEALTLYYDGKFAQALPMFKSISADVETMDIMWWLGTSAMQTGDMKLAIDKFKKMLVVDPGLHRVRLELAGLYFRMNQYKEARQELDIVKKANPPKDVQTNIDRLLAAIDESTRKVIFNVRFSQGVQWDSNVSSGTDQKVLSVTGGTLTLADDTKKVGDWAAVSNFYGSLLYDFGNRGGFMWNTTTNMYSQSYFQYGKYNYLLGDVATGLWWVGQRDVLKLPFGISKQEYGSSPLSTIFHFRPSLEHYFSPNLSLRGMVSWHRESFMDIGNANLNNTTMRYEIGPNFFFQNRRHIVSLVFGYESSIADARSFTYTAPYGSISYYTRFPTKTDFLVRYQVGGKDYKAAPVLYPDNRVDRLQSWSVILSQEFWKHYFASLAYNYVDNRSNHELYTFNKETYTLSVGFFF